ncbi:hypothetical protein D9758_015563 [Tetrapyrgos nigripes]|uniref:Uncharacterized protein n=1 Tax=Tetrapyrgos nigripes TaxID=182062 RepID=A0A8H5CCB9_9AGAR|nr:hypothetical protein D9758_015563 [Tetrapyrgos nigripes]
MDSFFSLLFPSLQPTPPTFSKPETLSILESWRDVNFDPHFDFHAEVNVDDFIISGQCQWVQVWNGRIHHKDQTIEIIIRIFQQSRFPFYCNGAEIAWNEACAYKQLKDLQGTIIPRLYGFHKVYVPADGSEEPCFAHIVEHVALSSLESLKKYGPLNEEVLFSLLDTLIPSLHEMHNCHIAYNKLWVNNVLVVFVNFALSSEEDVDSIREDGDFVVGVVTHLHGDLAVPIVMDWKNQHDKEPYAMKTFENVLLYGQERDRAPLVYPEPCIITLDDIATGFGFGGLDAGAAGHNTVVVSGSNWNDAASPFSVHNAYNAADMATFF